MGTEPIQPDVSIDQIVETVEHIPALVVTKEPTIEEIKELVASMMREGLKGFIGTGH